MASNFDKINDGVRHVHSHNTNHDHYGHHNNQKMAQTRNNSSCIATRIPNIYRNNSPPTTGHPSQLSIEYCHKTNKEKGSTKAIFIQNDTIVVTIELNIPSDINANDLTSHAYSIVIPLLVFNQIAGTNISEYELEIKCNQKYIKKHLTNAMKKSHSPSQCMSNEWDLFSTGAKILQQVKSFTILDLVEVDFHFPRGKHDNLMWKQEVTHTKISNIHLQLHYQRVAGDYKIALRQASTAPEIKIYY
jgi:hypothetical protein